MKWVVRGGCLGVLFFVFGEGMYHNGEISIFTTNIDISHETNFAADYINTHAVNLPTKYPWHASSTRLSSRDV